MKKFELMVEGYHTPLMAAEIAELFNAGRLRRNDPCRQVGQQSWRTVDEMFPLLKYDSSGRGTTLPPTGVSSFRNQADQPQESSREYTSALKAGWICFGIGLLLSWFFPLGHFFFSVAIVTAIVAMCTHQVNRGLVLLFSSLFGIAVCVLVFFTLVIGTVGVAAQAAMKENRARMNQIQQTQARQVQQLNNATAQLQSALRPTNNRISVTPSFSATAPERFTSGPSQQQQYEAAIQRQREADARKAADDAQRARNVYEAERQRDAAKGKEQELQRVQNSIDANDRIIRQLREANVSPKYYEDQRDSLLKEKAKLQGY